MRERVRDHEESGNFSDVSDSRLWQSFLSVTKNDAITLIEKLLEESKKRGVSFFIYGEERINLSSESVVDKILTVIETEKMKAKIMQQSHSTGARVGSIIDVTA